MWPGQRVLYVGRVSGGPRRGSRGLVKATLGRRAVVDMGGSGTWTIPYYLLEVPSQQGLPTSSAA